MEEADRVYEWTVRALYAALILGNLALAWEAWKDTPGGLAFRERAAAAAQLLRHCADCQRRSDWIRDRAHMLWQAEDVVRGAETPGEAP